MANTFELISAVTVGSGGASSIDFTSIPSTYTDLCLKVTGRTTGGNPDNGLITFNGSSSSFSYRRLFGDGSGAGSSAASANNINLLYTGSTATANTFANSEMYIPNYAGSTNKSFSIDTVAETNATEAYMYLIAGLWSNTAAITSIGLAPRSGGNFVEFSTAYLYGVKNA